MRRGATPLIPPLFAVLACFAFAATGGCEPGDLQDLADVRVQINVLERRLASDSVGFDWGLHNELRHLYSRLDIRKSLLHADAILQHSIMDDYILHILSDWTIDKDPKLAEVRLLTAYRGYEELKFVKAACHIKIGDLCAARGEVRDARWHYERVAGNYDPGLAAYRSLAQTRLRTHPLARPPGVPPRAAQAAEPARERRLGLGPLALLALPALLAWPWWSRRKARRGLEQGARALGARRVYPVCWRPEYSPRRLRLVPWDAAGLLLVHRGQPVFLSEEGEAWLGAGCKLRWGGRRAGSPWVVIEAPGRKHYFTAEPGLWPFSPEGPTRRLLDHLLEDIASSSPGKVAGREV